MRSGTTSLTQRFSTLTLALLCASPAAALCSVPPDPRPACGHPTVVRGRALGPEDHALGAVPPRALVVTVEAWSGLPTEDVEEGATVVLLKSESSNPGMLDEFAGGEGEVMVFLVDASTYAFALPVEEDEVVLSTRQPATMPEAEALTLFVDDDVDACVDRIYEHNGLEPFEGPCNDTIGCASTPVGAAAGLSPFLLLLRRRR